jgi:hypothetical protein
VPLHKEKGEISCSVGITDFQLGYSLTNHLAIFTDGKYRKTDFDYEYLDNKGTAAKDESYDIGGGVGLFKSFQNMLSFETLCGGGLGKLKYEFQDGTTNPYLFDLNTKKYNIYIQQNIGVTIKNHIEFGISAKLIKCEFYNINAQSNRSINPDYTDYNTYFIGKDKSSFTFFEPGFTFRGGFHGLKAQMQIVKVFELSHNPIFYRDLSFFLSINMNLNVRKTIKKREEEKKKNPYL